MEYIDAKKLRSEVERIKETGCESPILVCDDILSFIDYLQEEHLDVDKIKNEWYNKGYLKGRQEAHIPARELGLPKSFDFKQKVFGCRNDYQYGGGLILVAANTIEEAYLTAAINDKLSFLFDWEDDDGRWCAPDGNINHCVSEVYPLDKWFEMEHLSTDLTETQIIIEDHYSE